MKDLVVFTRIYLLWNSILNCLVLLFTIYGFIWLSLFTASLFYTVSLSFLFVSVSLLLVLVCALANVMSDGFGGFHTGVLVME